MTAGIGAAVSVDIVPCAVSPVIGAAPSALSPVIGAAPSASPVPVVPGMVSCWAPALGSAGAGVACCARAAGTPAPIASTTAKAVIVRIAVLLHDSDAQAIALLGLKTHEGRESFP